MVVRLDSFILSCAAALLLVQLASTAEAQPQYASKERSHTAVAHYARARAMCVETLEEFEAGRRFARPDLLLDAESWRLTLVSLCEKLNRLIDPKIRISSQGVQVASNPRMVRRAKDRLPAVADGPEPRSDVGEEKRLQEKQDARARMFAPTQRAAVPQEPEQTAPLLTGEQGAEEQAVPEQEAVPTEPEQEVAVQGEELQGEEGVVPSEEELLEQALQEATAIAEQDAGRNVAAPEQEFSNDEVPPQTEVAEIPPPDAEPPIDEAAITEGGMVAAEQGELTEDEKIAVAIEQAIQDKLSNMDAGSEPEAEEEEGLE